MTAARNRSEERLFARHRVMRQRVLESVLLAAAIAVAGVPAASLSEFVAYARSRQAQLSYGSPGTGTTSQLYVELFKSVAGIQMTHVPYKGGGPALADLIGGQVQAMLLSVTMSAPQVRN